jgi:hypothetical protein
MLSIYDIELLSEVCCVMLSIYDIELLSDEVLNECSYSKS